MTIKEYENKANELLERIEEERVLLNDVFKKMSYDLKMNGFSVASDKMFDFLCSKFGESVFEENNTYVWDNYKFYIEDLRKHIANYYNICLGNTYRKSYNNDGIVSKARKIKISNNYFDELSIDLMPSYFWVSRDALYGEKDIDGLLKKLNWDFSKAKYSIGKTENMYSWNYINLILGGCFLKGVEFKFGKLYEQIVEDFAAYVLKETNKNTFMVEYYENYLEYLNDVLIDFKRARLYLDHIKELGLIDEMLIGYGKDNKEEHTLKRKRVGDKIS